MHSSPRSETSLLDGISGEFLRLNHVLPLDRTDGAVRVAISGEPDPQVLDDLSLAFAAPVELSPTEPEALDDAIRRALDAHESMAEGSLVAGPAEGETGPASLADVRDLASQPPVVKYVNALLLDAHAAGASDVHLESVPAGLRVRLRLDGVLHDADPPPRPLTAAVISRVKLLADLDIADRRTSQDGRIRARFEDRELDLRVSTVPSLFGESVVLRILDRGGRPVALDELGMDDDTYKAFKEVAARPNGIALVTGPTGAGKTTTLYAAMGLRDSTSEKIITVEDPVEYQLPGTTQIPVNVAAGMTFARVLRGVLRQDPNVLVVGEMRDGETAEIAIRAALTGHMVFSTLHTNDAVSAMTRLTDLGVDDYLVASTLEAVLAQRLVRKICSDCRRPYRPDPQLVATLAGKPVGALTLERGAGCAACRQTGFKGRTGIFELVRVDGEMREAVLRRASRAELKELAVAKGMRPLRAAAWLKVQAGITTVEEALRVTSD